MTVKDFMNTVFETPVSIFQKGETFEKPLCYIESGGREWEKYGNRSIAQTEAVVSIEDIPKIVLVIQ